MIQFEFDSIDPLSSNILYYIILFLVISLGCILVFFLLWHILTLIINELGPDIMIGAGTMMKEASEMMKDAEKMMDDMGNSFEQTGKNMKKQDTKICVQIDKDTATFSCFDAVKIQHEEK